MQSLSKLYFLTKNKNKLREVSYILKEQGIAVEWLREKKKKSKLTTHHL